MAGDEAETGGNQTGTTAEPGGMSATQPAATPVPAAPKRLYRHRLTTRLWHWTNAVTIMVMLGTGLMILNAHPHLYWGQYGANPDPAWFHVSWVFQGGHVPGWLTIPSSYNLALARHWHLTFAWVFAFGLLGFMVASLINRHFQKDMVIRPRDLSPAHIWFDIKEHLAFRFHDAANPGAFNVLQKLSYVGVIFVLIPAMIYTGLCMSPGFTAVAPWMLDLVGGRASARSIHFIAAMGLAGFAIVHLTLVILAGPINEVRSMVTGWWTVPQEEH